MSARTDAELLSQVDRFCVGPAPDWDALLELGLRRLACETGSIHVLDATTNLLHLRVQRGIPEAIRPAVERIPVGKGMAGLAAERKAPVGACNLQTDSSGDVRPGAKLTAMKGALCVPMLDGSGAVRGTFGVARRDEHEFDAAETSLLLAIAARIGRALAAPGAG
ncbi:MAG: GAF domain-containing protein [Planctomycetes bacterium]|nr:GAF domain-containing protein [Planctomycetota bacterium]